MYHILLHFTLSPKSFPMHLNDKDDANSPPAIVVVIPRPSLCPTSLSSWLEDNEATWPLLPPSNNNNDDEVHGSAINGNVVPGRTIAASRGGRLRRPLPPPSPTDCPCPMSARVPLPLRYSSHSSSYQSSPWRCHRRRLLLPPSTPKTHHIPVSPQTTWDLLWWTTGEM